MHDGCKQDIMTTQLHVMTQNSLKLKLHVQGKSQQLMIHTKNIGNQDAAKSLFCRIEVVSFSITVL